MTSQVTIESIDEIRTLHRMLFARKFDGPEDEFFGSPFISAVQRRLFDALRTIDEHSWDDWAAPDHHPREVEKVRSYIRRVGWPSGAPVEERRAIAVDLLSPLGSPDDLLAELTAL